MIYTSVLPCKLLYSKIGVYKGIVFLIFALNIDCGYSWLQSIFFSKNKKNVKTFHK